MASFSAVAAVVYCFSTRPLQLSKCCVAVMHSVRRCSDGCIGGVSPGRIRVYKMAALGAGAKQSELKKNHLQKKDPSNPPTLQYGRALTFAVSSPRMSNMDVGLSLSHPASSLDHALQLLPQGEKGLGGWPGPAHWRLLVPTQKAVIVTVTVARPEGKWNREGGQSRTEPEDRSPRPASVLGLCSSVHVGDGITTPPAFVRGLKIGPFLRMYTSYHGQFW